MKKKQPVAVHCFITAFGHYRMEGSIALLMATKDYTNKRTKRFKKIKELESLITELDVTLYQLGLSLTDLRFK